MKKHMLYRRVAELHVKNIDRGFLSTLGIGVVSLMYQAIDEGSDSVLLVSMVDNQVVGFVAGATGMRYIYLRMLRRWPRLLIALLPSLFSPRRIWRIIEILRYSGGATSSNSLPSAELLSIAIDPSFRGKAHAEKLYCKLMNHFRSKKVQAFKIVVGAALTPAHAFYRRMGAEPVAEMEIHSGQASVIYIHRLDNAY